MSKPLLLTALVVILSACGQGVMTEGEPGNELAAAAPGESTAPGAATDSDITSSTAQALVPALWGGSQNMWDRTVLTVLSMPGNMAALSWGVTWRVNNCIGKPCHWGIYDHYGQLGSTNTVWLAYSSTKNAFADQTRLYYVVTHELGHRWFRQWLTDNQRTFMLAVFGGDEEKLADCAAKYAGAGMQNYWNCPANFVNVMNSAFAATNLHR